MFFYLSINHYAPVLIRFSFGFGAGKKGGSYDGIWYGLPAPPYFDGWFVKSCVGWVTGFGLGVCFVPSSTA